jgi:hypothetical protein
MVDSERAWRGGGWRCSPDNTSAPTFESIAALGNARNKQAGIFQGLAEPVAKGVMQLALLKRLTMFERTW